jgi:hypothetical protein
MLCQTFASESPVSSRATVGSSIRQSGDPPHSESRWDGIDTSNHDVSTQFSPQIGPALEVTLQIDVAIVTCCCVHVYQLMHASWKAKGSH